jgi:hypothetical protein
LQIVPESAKRLAAAGRLALSDAGGEPKRRLKALAAGEEYPI